MFFLSGKERTRAGVISFPAMRTRWGISLVCLLIAAGVALTAADWPQYLGPQRNGVYTGPPLATTWPAGGPKRVWDKRVGQGFAGPVVAGDRLILFHRIGREEVVDAFAARTGEPRWHFAYPTNYRDDFGFDEGPRAVPVVAGGRVYTYGAEGQLHAIDLATGRRVWSVDAARRFNVRKGFFGAAGSPLVEDGRVIANIGGTDGDKVGDKGAGIVAFNADTGAVLWTATSHEASYSSPVGAVIGGKRVAVFLTRRGLVGLDPATGSVLFERMWRSRSASSVNAATPLVVGDQIFISAAYETGATLVRVQGSELKQLWASDEVLSNHYATSVYANGTLYGFHGRQEYGPSLRAVDFSTGKVLWNVDRFKAGTVTLAGDTLLILRESGELMLASATPQAFRPLAETKILPATIRATPALADGFLYVRNTDNPEPILVCLDLRP
jgi:outer membrane protein assembly factor BamB